MFEGSIIYQKAYDFALEIIRIYKSNRSLEMIDLFRQLLKSGTSIGANLAESLGGLSTADFSSKVSIAYKEALETRYWLSLLRDSKNLDQSDFASADAKAEEICKIAYSILKSTGRIKQQNDKK
jgi:four helix bundle protein